MKLRMLLLTFLGLVVVLLSPVCALSVTASVPSVQALSGTTDYTYNALSQLTLEDSTRSGGFAYTFAYDDAGNPTTFKGVTHTFDGVLNQQTGESFVYDDNGNPTTYKGTSGFTYDPNNHLTTIPNELTMGYHQGLRAWKDDGTDRTYFLYSGATPVCEMDEDGDVIATNTFGANGLVARTEGENTTFYTFDEGGNTAQILDSDGDVVATHLYDAYGNSLYGSSSYPYGYGGQHGYYTDEETGLVLATYRYYDPTEGRWLTRDPIGYAGGLNLYGYCGDNPVNGIDPLGLRWDVSPDWSDPWGTIIGPGLATGWEAVNSAFSLGSYDGGRAEDDPGFGVSKVIGYVAFGAGAAACVLNAIGNATSGSTATHGFGSAEEPSEGGIAACEAASGGGAEPPPLEWHHLLPQAPEFEPYFNQAGLNVDNYVVGLSPADHRLLPGGLHTNGMGEWTNWNAQWSQFFESNPDANASQIMDQLSKMVDGFNLGDKVR